MKNFHFTLLPSTAFWVGMVTFLMSFVPDILSAQPWTYNFGTGTGTANNSNSGSGNTSFFTGTPTGGGTYRVRIGTGSGSLVLANPGTSLGTNTEVQLTASSSASTNKFTVFGWNSPSNTAYVKFKIRTTSTGNGVLVFHLGSGGSGTIYQDNNNYTNYTTSIVTLVINYSGGSISTVQRRIDGSFNNISSSGIAKDTDQEIEIYANNGSASTTYSRNGSNSLNAQTWDLWVDGTKISPSGGFAKASNSFSAGNLAGFGFFAESSTSNAAVLYLDDLEYSNALPIAPPTISSTGTPTALTTTYGTASSSTSFNVSGVDMQAGITVTPPAGFEVSTNNSTFSNTVLVGAAGTIASTPVYIRLKADATPGNYSGNIVLSSTNATSQHVSMPSSTVNTKQLTISGLTANNKTYDGNNTATLSGTASLVGIVGSDDVSLSGSPTATFATPDAGTGIAVTVTGYTLSGAQASFYTLQQPIGLTADINKANQTITFNPLPTLSTVNTPFNLTATASSNLTVTFTSSDPAVATVSGNTVTIVGAGTTTITASQAGNANYLAAPDVPQTLTVLAPIVHWNFTAGDANPNFTANSVTSSAISQGNNNGTTTLITSTSTSSGYPGVTGTNNAGAAARIGSLNTGTNGSAYFEFTLTAQIGTTIQFTGLFHGARSTGTGPLAYSLRSNADNYATDLANGSYLNDLNWVLKSNTGFSSTITNGGSVTYRLFGYNGTGSPSINTANWRIDDVVLTGTITCNTPAAYAVTGGGTYCAGGSGVAIGLANSQLGMTYQLQRDGNDVGMPMAGTGNAISFGNQTVAGTYSVVAKNLNGSCNVETPQTGTKTVTVTPLPDAPTGDSPQVFCSTDNATIANLVVVGTNILWYDAATGGNQLNTSTALVNNITYYASQTVSGCESGTRLPVLVNITPASTFYFDNDGDTYGNPMVSVQACSAPTDYVTNNSDCNDNDAAINPAAMEVCNGIDDNCNSSIDDGLTFINYYIDADGDTYGDQNATAINACQSPGSNYVTNNSDCNDNNAAINPAATEVCNGIDDDCDSVIDEGFVVIQTTAAITNTGCGGVSIGAIDLTVTQGTPTGFLWSNTANTEDISNLGAGSYTVTVTSNEGCTKAFTYGVEAADGLNAAFQVVHVTCFGSANGTIFTTPSGGTPPYSYNWNNGKTTKNINLLVANTYILTLTDNVGCSTIFNVPVTQPPVLNFTLAGAGAGPYTVTITATGGTPGYTYNRTGMTNFQSSNVFENVLAGSYIFKVKDANDCQKSRIAKVPITSPMPGTPIADRSQDVSNGWEASQPAQLFVFPNPADEMLQVELLNREHAAGQLKIADLTGRILLEKTVQMFENEAQAVSVAHFVPGMYQVIFVENSGKVLAKNFVVTH